MLPTFWYNDRRLSLDTLMLIAPAKQIVLFFSVVIVAIASRYTVSQRMQFQKQNVSTLV